MRLIDADALMKTLGITDMDCDKCAWCDKKWSRCKRGSDFEDACCAIEDAPTIEERKRGEWVKSIYHGDEFTWHQYHCSVCGVERKIGWFKDVFYCPNCGARMEDQHG